MTSFGVRYLTRRIRRAALLGSFLLGVAPAQGQFLIAGDTAGALGATAGFDVTLLTFGAPVVATRNDLGFESPAIRITTCEINPDLAANLFKTLSLSFLPSGCSGAACTAVRVIIGDEGHEEGNTLGCRAMPDGVVLYRCQVAIAADATDGPYLNAVNFDSASDVIGNSLGPLAQQSGYVYTGGGCP